MKRLFLPLAAILALAVSSCKNDDPVNLKLALEPGSKYLYAMDMKMKMTQSMSGQTVSTDQDMLMESTYDVAADGGDNRKITVTYDRISMEVRNPQANMKYDSKEPSKGDPKLASMGGMIGKPFSMSVTPQGEITRVEGLGNILNSIGDTTTEEGVAMRKTMAQTFNDSAIRSMMQQSLNIFPDHPVRPGDTWKKIYSTNMGVINMTIENVFTLKDVAGKTAHLDVNAVIKGGGAMAAPEMQNMQINLSGDQKGTMDVEVATGLVTESKLKQNIKGDISAMGMKIPMTISSDIHLTAKKK